MLEQLLDPTGGFIPSCVPSATTRARLQIRDDF